MRLIISPRAEKSLKKLLKAFQIIIARKIRILVTGIIVRNEVLTGYKKVYKTRVGVYRIVYKRFPDSVYIILIEHRREVYLLLKRLLG